MYTFTQANVRQEEGGAVSVGRLKVYDHFQDERQASVLVQESSAYLTGDKVWVRMDVGQNVMMPERGKASVHLGVAEAWRLAAALVAFCQDAESGRLDQRRRGDGVE